KSEGTGDKDQTLAAKLTGDKVVDGREVWVVEVSGTLKMAGDFKLPAQGPNGTPNPLAGKIAAWKSETQIVGTGLIDKKTGQIVHLDAKSKAKQNVSIGDVGMNVDTSSVSNTVVQLIS